MIRSLLIILTLLFAPLATAQVQWSTKVIDFSSQYDDGGFSANAALGEPDMLIAGFQPGGWTPGFRTKGTEKKKLTAEQHITVEFDTVMSVQQVVVVGTAASSVKRIVGYTDKGKDVMLHEQKKPEQHVIENALRANFERVERVKQVMVVIDPNAIAGWQQIDAIGVADHHRTIELPKVGTHAIEIQHVLTAGDRINTEHAEFADALDPSGSDLYFSRVTTGTSANVYRTWMTDAGIRALEKIDLANESSHAFIGGMTANGDRVAIGVDAEVTIVRIDDDQTGPAIVQVIDSFYTHADHFTFCMSPDAESLILALERDDSYGGTDLYVSARRGDQRWGAPRNLGRAINTAMNETAPTMSYDGRTLYFSSNGRAGYGGYDIFASKLQNSGWSTAVNLSDKINSEFNEQFFVTDKAAGAAYFSSDRPGGHGKEDIYVAYPMPSDTGFTLKGSVTEEGTGKAVRARIEIDLIPSRINVAVDSSSVSGNYSIDLPYLAKYELRVTADGYFPLTEFISAPRYLDERVISRELVLTPLVPGTRVELQGVEFEIGSATLQASSEPALKAVHNLLVSRPKMRVEIAGHTDNIGDAAANMILSIARAESVVKRLVELGVSPPQLIAKGYGETKPIATNNSASGREKNRRVEFLVIE